MGGKRVDETRPRARPISRVLPSGIFYLVHARIRTEGMCAGRAAQGTVRCRATWPKVLPSNILDSLARYTSLPQPCGGDARSGPGRGCGKEWAARNMGASTGGKGKGRVRPVLLVILVSRRVVHSVSAWVEMHEESAAPPRWLIIRQTPGRTRTSTSPCGPAAINGFSAILKILMILREFQRGELHASVRKSEDAFPIIIRGASDPAPTLAARTQAKSPAPRCWRT